MTEKNTEKKRGATSLCFLRLSSILDYVCTIKLTVYLWIWLLIYIIILNVFEVELAKVLGSNSCPLIKTKKHVVKRRLSAGKKVHFSPWKKHPTKQESVRKNWITTFSGSGLGIIDGILVSFAFHFSLHTLREATWIPKYATSNMTVRKDLLFVYIFQVVKREIWPVFGRVGFFSRHVFQNIKRPPFDAEIRAPNPNNVYIRS